MCVLNLNKRMEISNTKIMFVPYKTLSKRMIQCFDICLHLDNATS